MFEDEEKDSYHDTRRQFVTDLASEFEKVEFKLIDLVGEFIDDQDNTILIQDEMASDPEDATSDLSDCADEISADDLEPGLCAHDVIRCLLYVFVLKQVS